MVDDYNADVLPEDSLTHGMDGIVQELTALYGYKELESSYLAFLMNIEGLTSTLVDCWKEQGRGDSFSINAETIGGLLETINWVREKALELITVPTEQCIGETYEIV